MGAQDPRRICCLDCIQGQYPDTKLTTPDWSPYFLMWSITFIAISSSFALIDAALLAWPTTTTMDEQPGSPYLDISGSRGKCTRAPPPRIVALPRAAWLRVSRTSSCVRSLPRAGWSPVRGGRVGACLSRLLVSRARD